MSPSPRHRRLRARRYPAAGRTPLGPVAEHPQDVRRSWRPLQRRARRDADALPGRAGFLTGLHTHHHGTYKTDGSLFRPGETIATSLQDSGYYTIQVGKYLNLFEAVYPKLPPGWSDFRGYGGGYYDYRIWANGVPTFLRAAGRKDFSTDVIARMSLMPSRGLPAAGRSSRG